MDKPFCKRSSRSCDGWQTDKLNRLSLQSRQQNSVVFSSEQPCYKINFLSAKEMHIMQKAITVIKRNIKFSKHKKMIMYCSLSQLSEIQQHRLHNLKHICLASFYERIPIHISRLCQWVYQVIYCYHLSIRVELSTKFFQFSFSLFSHLD